MPKSRRRRKKSNFAPMTPRMESALKEQREAFRKKFGREPGPGDPVFFDPDADPPTQMSPLRMQADMLETMRRAGTRPEIVYAYRKTGFLLTASNKDQCPPDQRKEWDDAIDEYFAIEAAKAEADKPHPAVWNTKIPELLASPFGRQDLDKVRECLRAIAPIEQRGMSIVTRVELTAAFMATTCAHAFESAEDNGEPDKGPDRFAMTEELVLRRARELYAQRQSPDL